MSVIFETTNFTVEAMDQPLVDRKDGGHIVINPRNRIGAIQHLEPVLAIELMRLLVVVGAAMTSEMQKHGVDIGRINYQDNGNWGVFLPDGPYQHFHLYGRAKSAEIQKYGQACYFPHKTETPEFYESLEPLNQNDISAIRKEIERLLGLEEYSDRTWKLKQ